MTTLKPPVRFLRPGSYRARLSGITKNYHPEYGYVLSLTFLIQEPPCEGMRIRDLRPGIPNLECSVPHFLGRISSGYISTDGPDAEEGFLKAEYQIAVAFDRVEARHYVTDIYML